VIISSSPSIALVDYTNVPSYVASSLIVSLPTSVVQVETSTVTIPSSWSSPVAVPVTEVSTLPSTEVLVIASAPSVAIIESWNVPTYVSSSVV